VRQSVHLLAGKIRVVGKFPVVQCSTEKVSIVSDQWCCEVKSEHRTDLKSISSYEWCDNNCSKISIIITILN
jgi:hypothetical protein